MLCLEVDACECVFPYILFVCGDVCVDVCVKLLYVLDLLGGRGEGAEVVSGTEFLFYLLCEVRYVLFYVPCRYELFVCVIDCVGEVFSGCINASIV